MAYKLELPDIGEGVVEAEVQQWFVSPGDVVAEDQPLVEVMTDKATVVIPSPRRGKIVKLFWNVGDVAKVHSPLVEMELEEAAAPASKEPPEPARPAAAARADFGPPAGRAPPAGAPQKALATPAVRAMAREMGIDLQAVSGSGPGGRVTKDDLTAHRNRRNGHPAPASATSAPPHPAPSPPLHVPPSPPRSGGEGLRDRGGEGRGEGGAGDVVARTPVSGAEQRIPLRGVRKRMFEHMALAKRTAAHFTFVEEADVTELIRVKERIAAAAKEEGVRMTFLPFAVKAVVAALKKHPKLNATMDEARGELVLHGRYDLGIASATDAGLVVPVLRGADRRSLLDVAREIERLAADARAGHVRPEDLGRSTFTITSLGAMGGLLATPVLNVPEVGILGLHRIRPTPVVRDGAVVVRDVMHVSVTCDHRVVDGYEAAAFAYEVIRGLEDPNLLFMRMV